MRKDEQASEQLRGILQEVGEVDYTWIVNQLHHLHKLDNPSDEYVSGILEHFKGTWEEFRYIWRGYHIYCIGKRMWRKFEKISKKYPNFDKIICEIEKDPANDIIL